MEKDFSSDEESEQLPGEVQIEHSESEPPSSENEDEEEEYMSEQEEIGEEFEDGKEGDLEEDREDDTGGEGGVEGDAEGEEGEKQVREEGNLKLKKKTFKRKKSKVKGDSAQPKAKRKRKGKEPLAKKKKRRPSKPKHLRRDIKTLIKETELDDQTVAAQREEEERIKRLEEQRAQNTSPPALLTQLLETTTSDLLAEHRQRSIADSNEYILLESSSGEEDKKQTFPELKQTKPELIEILSSDEEVKVLSESEEKDEEEEEEESGAEFGVAPVPGPDEESGTHTDDTKNRPDEEGRVLVNVSHPLHEQDIYLPPHLAGKVKAHQIGGIRFLYDNLVESLNRFSSSAGFGCILAHSMGLGKTLQVICFSDIFLRYTTARSVLIIVPINTLQNWIAEFDMWLPSEGDPSTGRQGRTFNLHVLNDTHKTTVARAKVICEWYQNGGVMLMGYEIYRLLCNRRFTGKPKRRKKKKAAHPEVIDLEEEERMEKELENIRYAICNPGPDLVICDEGHRIKNSLAGISKALKNIKTRRRVVLTGYPLQNNLMEYWCMVDFVRPNYLGTKHEFSNLFERPIQNGQCTDSTAADIKFMRYRAHVLHNKLEGFVQRRGFQVLKLSLPDKHEHIIMVRLTQFQKGLYCKFMQCFKDVGAGGWCSTNPLKAFAVGCKIWNHPDILFDVLQKNETDVDTDLDIPDIASKTGHKKQTQAPIGSMTSGTGSPTCIAEDVRRSNGISSFEDQLENMSYQDKVNQIISFEWARENMRNYTHSKISNGGKMVLLFHIIEESIRVGDKILVFSQSLMTLSLIEKFLSLRSIPDPPNKAADMSNDWIRNLTYFRLDGSTAGTERERMINQFNKPNNPAWLFLLSTRAGCLGVNLIGANRVVVLDASWNPCHDAQAVCRVYRYGQKKTCHIYRMVTDNTLEKKIYDRQISKKGMSDRVVDELNPQMNLTKREVESLLDFDESDMPFEDFGHLADTFQDSVLQTICRDHSQVICKAPFSTESLLWDRKDQRLSRAEKRLAKKSYEDELRLNTNYNRPSYPAYYPKPEQYSGSANPAPSGGYDTSLPYLLNMRGQIQIPKRPVASVRPLQSTPVPKYPPTPGLGLSKPVPDIPLDTLKGLSVQKIVATTDILLPGVNTLSNSTTKIKAGETVTFFKTQRGIYLRTPEGRFIAVRGPNTRNASQMLMQRPSLLNSDRDRDSPHSSSSGETIDLSNYSTPLLSSTNSTLVNSIQGSIPFIPQLTDKSMEDGSGSVTMGTVMSSDTLDPSAISDSSNGFSAVPSAAAPYRFSPLFVPPLSNESAHYYTHQTHNSFPLSGGTPPLLLPPSSMTTMPSDLASFFSPQGIVATSGDALSQDVSLSQGNIMSPSTSHIMTQVSLSSPTADTSPLCSGDLPHTTTVTDSPLLCSGDLPHTTTITDSLTQGAIMAEANMIASGSGYSVGSPSRSMPLHISPSIPTPEMASSSGGGFQGGDSVPFLSVPPQLPTLDANSVEQILRSTSSDSEINSSNESSTSVQSSNLASLSEFVSSRFQ